MNLDSIFDIPEICYRMGIRDAVISPGSRNAPLTIAFVRYKKIRCLSVPDERSGAFIALGMSLQTHVPTVLICTSGSAGLNYAPAVAEAFFNRVPLLILTADRPEELINIRDGQTIFQKNLYGKHVKASFDFPSQASESLESQHKVIIEAINQARMLPEGPVHINLPFEEPFYPEKDEIYTPTPELKSLNYSPQKTIDEEVPISIQDFKKILIVAGQAFRNDEMISCMNKISATKKIPVVADVISNLHGQNETIVHHDLFLSKQSDKDLMPDLIITTGLSVLSKKLKQLLKDCPDAEHWHVSSSKDSADTFGKLSKTIPSDPIRFFEKWAETKSPISDSQKEHFKNWTVLEEQAKTRLKSITALPFSDAKAYQMVVNQLPEKIDLHLSNSMAVRYVNLFGLEEKKKISVFCNRGTSGIDGSNSTTVGSALASGKETLLLTGDLAFLYDRNAFWHNHLPDHLKIIIFNNGGGGIFRLIKGPSEQPELETYFETRQNSNAEYAAREFGFEYSTSRNEQELAKCLQSFFLSGRRSILEIFTDKVENQKAFKQLLEIME